jgi:chemotaxis protein MotB
MNARTIAIAVVAGLLAGCVTQGTFDTLKMEHDATRQELEAKNARVAEYEQKNAEQERKLRAAAQAEQALQEALAEEQRRATELAMRVTRLEKDLANVVKDKSTMEASVADMTAALAELQKRKDQAEARMAEYRALLSKFRSLIDAGKLTVKIVEGRMVVVLATDVLFGSGSASLSREGKEAIAEVAQLLASIPQRNFQIEGHTDNVPIRTAQYPSNWELAAARSLTVLKTMVDAGMPPNRISAAAFGDAKPAASNETPEGKSQNRRIEIIIVPDLSTLPGFDELKRVERGS